MVTTVAFSPDGDTLISGEKNELLENIIFRLWDVKRGTSSQIFTIPHTDLPWCTFHLSFPTQNRIILWTRELPTDPLLKQHSSFILNKTAPRWDRVSKGHSPPINSPDDVVDARIHDHLLIVERSTKPPSFYNNEDNITAVRRRGPNIIIGDRAGYVTFLLLQEVPENRPLSPSE